MKTKQIHPKLISFLTKVKANSASELHIRVDDIPYLRIKGNLEPIDHDILTNADIFEILTTSINDNQMKKWKTNKSHS